MTDGQVLEYCIGTPGEAPRMFMVTGEEQVKINVMDGEVYFHDANFAPWPHIITANAPYRLVSAETPSEWALRTRWSQAKDVRDQHMVAGCDSPKGRIDTGITSQSRIVQFTAEAAVAKLTATPWSIDWTMEDNTHLAHNAEEMIALCSAMNAHMAACHAAAQAIREKINAAPTGDAVMKIDIDQGYPG